MEILVFALGALGALGLIAVVVLRRRAERAALCAEEARRILPILEDAARTLSRGEYIAQSELDVWKSAHAAAVGLASRVDLANHLPPDDAARFRALCHQLADPARTVRELNAAFVTNRANEDRLAFDRVERYPLTSNQRRAVVTDEDTTLVVAGAGTGKTSTIVGKVEYLVRRGLAAPSDILVLAFTRKASEELKDRLSRFGPAGDAEISTFHALGYKIVGEAEGKRPPLSSLAEDPTQLRKFLRDQVRELLSTREGQSLLTRWFAEYLDEARSDGAGITGDERIRAEKARGLRTISGVKVKSRQEVQIGNWLTLNGIRWEYERQYPVDTATPWHRPYRPDFYLPDYDLYIEHFGINRDGSTAPHVDAQAYRQAMEWKRQLHRQHGTRLVETFSFFAQEGGLITQLATLLEQQGVIAKPLTQQQIDELTAEANRGFSDFVNLVTQFVSVYKGNGGNPALAQQRAATARDRVFLEVFDRLYEAYERELARSGEIDFNDMINRARAHIQRGTFRARYKYIIVDEFQDISENRLGLLQDLRTQTPHGRLFAVGDDWQSIYRFTGSDINIITDLPSRVGATARVDLDVTFRYPQELLDLSSAFVTKNPAQLRKTLRAHQEVANPFPVSILFRSTRGESGEARAALGDALRDIAGRDSARPATVFVLGRYHFNKPEPFAAMQRAWFEHGIHIEYMTAHAAKGKEADYVIVVGLEAGEYGFPSNVADDPVMKMVLSEAEQYPYAEERRLFYVALTRARRRVYLIAPRDSASPFIIDDLLAEPLSAHVETIGEVSERHRCPRCQGKTIRRTEGQYGAFWACANYPLCHGRLDTCHSCGEGALIPPEGDGREYCCTDCQHTVELCPRCRVGYLRPRTGPYGEFLACSDWRGGAGCTYTRNA